MDDQSPHEGPPNQGQGVCALDEDGKLRWGSFPKIVELITTTHQSLVPQFILTFWTFSPPEYVISTLISRFYETKDNEVKENVMKFFQTWVTLDSSPFELEYSLWKNQLGPWLVNLVRQDKKWYHDARDISTTFFAPLIEALWSEWRPLACAILFQPSTCIFSEHQIPRDCLLTILGWSMKLRGEQLCMRIARAPPGFDQVINPSPPASLKKSKSDKKSKLSRSGQKLKKMIETKKHVFDWDIQEIAQQLTYRECDLFMKIRPTEIFCYIQKQAERDVYSPNVRLLIGHFEKTCSWLKMTIVTASTLPQRVKIITNAITLLEHLFALKNYFGSLEVIAALNSSSVSRLKDTLDAVPKKSIKSLESIAAILDPTQNYKQLRDLMMNDKREGTPFLPYLGLCIQDLAYIMDGLPNYIREGEINWHKNDMLFKSLMSFSVIPYQNLPVVPQLQEKFTQFVRVPGTVEYQFSLYYEPLHRPQPDKPDFVWAQV